MCVSIPPSAKPSLTKKSGRYVRNRRREQSQGRASPHCDYGGKSPRCLRAPSYPDNYPWQHWHGFFQTDNNLMAGVDTVTQCPISPTPGSNSFTYKFNTGSQGIRSLQRIAYIVDSLHPLLSWNILVSLVRLLYPSLRPSMLMTPPRHYKTQYCQTLSISCHFVLCSLRPHR